MNNPSSHTDVLEQKFPLLDRAPETDDHFIRDKIASESELDDRFVASDVGPIEHEERDGRKSSRRKRLFCFECNRQEGHIMAGENRFIFSFLVGMTLGLIYIVGPYTCQCCGAQRLFRYDTLNPAYWFQSAKQNRASKSNRRRRRRSPK